MDRSCSCNWGHTWGKNFVKAQFHLCLRQWCVTETYYVPTHVQKIAISRKNIVKAELLQEGIFFLIHLFARDVLVMKKLEIEKTKPTFIISVLKLLKLFC